MAISVRSLYEVTKDKYKIKLVAGNKGLLAKVFRSSLTTLIKFIKIPPSIIVTVSHNYLIESIIIRF